MIVLRQVNKYYDKNKPNEMHALKDVNLTIPDGEMLGIVGPSGAGKSTLLHILAGIDTADSGSYHFNNTKISGLSPRTLSAFRNKQVGIVLQDFSLVEEYTVLQNVMIPLCFAKGRLPKSKKETAMECLELIGIQDLAGKASGKISGGQKQRVAIARALVNSPGVLLADEPTGALDSKTSEEILRVFLELNAHGHTVVLITHEQKIAGYCHRVVRISDGVLEE